jgi:hypothetical protein
MHGGQEIDKKSGLEILKGRDLVTEERILLKQILRNRVRGCGSDSSDSGQGLVAGNCEPKQQNMS